MAGNDTQQLADGKHMAAQRQVGRRDTWQAMRLGWKQLCPACGIGLMFGKYLKVNDACEHCGQELHHQRADDAPPYFTMFIVGHVVIGALLIVERKYQPDLWVHAALWVPLTIGLSLWLLPRIKGLFVAQQWAMRMHGFGSAPDPSLPELAHAVRVSGAERGRHD